MNNNNYTPKLINYASENFMWNLEKWGCQNQHGAIRTVACGKKVTYYQKLQCFTKNYKDSTL